VNKTDKAEEEDGMEEFRFHPTEECKNKVE
jgi:hypothetical protein